MYLLISLDQVVFKLSYKFFIRHCNSDVPFYNIDSAIFKQFVEKLFINNIVLLCIGTAFLLIDPGAVSGRMEDSGLTETIKTFTQVHRNCFLLLYVPIIGNKEKGILSEIQHR